MAGTLTRTGGSAPSPSYEALRKQLAEIFDTCHDVNAYEVIRGGTLWLVKAGIVVAPHAPFHEYAIQHRCTGTQAGNWYESELKDTASETVLAFAFAPERGYQTAFYANQEAQECFFEATPQHYAGVLAIMGNTMYSEQMSLTAAQEYGQKSKG